MKMMNYWCKFFFVGLYLIVFASVACQGQRNKKEVVYRELYAYGGGSVGFLETG